ncbi:hypothetical protein OK074_8857 [Actinobacteria bacterium OK074]|nr:hypothetical protein OK074_8857 [Actinobacteria bacterium OK074]
MSDTLHCPNCPKGKLYPFRPVTAAEEKHIAAELRGKKGAHGFWRCEGSTSLGQCLWVQPYHARSQGFSLPASFS